MISPSLRIPGRVEAQNAAIDRLMKKQERYDTTCGGNRENFQYLVSIKRTYYLSYNAFDGIM